MPPYSRSKSAFSFAQPIVSMPQDGKMVRTLKGHGHWVNTLALSSEYALRTGPHDHHGRAPADPVAAKQARTAAECCQKVKAT